jgi:hypothetical protein
MAATYRPGWARLAGKSTVRTAPLPDNWPAAPDWERCILAAAGPKGEGIGWGQ